MRSRKKNWFKLLKRKWKYFILSLMFFIAFLAIKSADFENLNKVFNNNKVSNSSSETLSKENLSDFDLKVHFLDVGKADCIYINFKKHNILIDAADKEPNGAVVNYLKKQDVSKISLVAVTHPHRDHIGQMSDVINEFEIEKFIEPKIPDNLIPTGFTYEKMLKNLESKSVNTEIVKVGKKFDLDGLKIEVLGPVNDGKNLNNNSIVLKMTYKDISFLFVGDAEKDEENDILKLGCDVKADVLKVGHHGSKTSSSENFLKNVNPKYAVILVGPDRNNLPKEEIIKRIQKYCKNIYRTDTHGNIIILTNGKEIKVETQKS